MPLPDVSQRLPLKQSSSVGLTDICGAVSSSHSGSSTAAFFTPLSSKAIDGNALGVVPAGSVSQDPQNFRSCETQPTCDGCFFRPVCLLRPLPLIPACPRCRTLSHTSLDFLTLLGQRVCRLGSAVLPAHVKDPISTLIG